MKLMAGVLLMAALIAACGDGVGEITKFDPVAEKNGSQDFSDTLEEKDVLETESSGLFIFTMNEVIDQCNQYGSSELIIMPGSNILIEVVKAPFSTPVVCSTVADPGKWTLASSNTIAEGADPIFSIGTEGGQTVVKVVFGFVNVTSIGSGDRVLVGPMQQTEVVGEAAPVEPFPIELSQFELEVFDGFLTELPPSPDSGLDESGRLAEAIDRGVVLVAFDPNTVGIDDAISIAGALAETLAAEWDATVEFVPTDDPRGLYTAEDVDLILSPDDGLGEAVPFFGAPDEPWFLAAPGDSAFVTGFSEVYRGFLEAGMYQEAFDSLGAVPTYDVFEDLLQP